MARKITNYASAIHTNFVNFDPKRSICKLSENSGAGGATVEYLVDRLKVECNWTYRDFSVAVTDIIDADEWSSDWAESYFLFVYLEGINDPVVSAKMFEPPLLLTWLITNFDRIYSLMCDAEFTERKKAFFDFQTRERKDRSDQQVATFKKARLTES